jgi:hypothetical protein
MNQPFQYGCDDAEPLFPEDGLPADFHYGCSRCPRPPGADKRP